MTTMIILTTILLFIYIFDIPLFSSPLFQFYQNLDIHIFNICNYIMRFYNIPPYSSRSQIPPQIISSPAPNLSNHALVAPIGLPTLL